LHAHLERSFPRVHATLARETVGGLSLVYIWRGREAALKPVLFMAHLDVVPIEEASAARWTHAPFSGEVADGFIWGRGAMDDKMSALALLEAAEMLLAEGFAPRRTIFFAFGHDEETGGVEGNKRVAALFAE